MAKTRTDPGVSAPSPDDPIQLREWGTDRVYPLPFGRTEDWLVGTAPDCGLRLQDRGQYVSRRHAVIRRVDACWSIADADSKNGLWIDGQRVARSTLTPGIEIGIARLRLVVESPALIRRRQLVARMLGWSVERGPAVDRALRALRAHGGTGTPLWLTGADDLVAIARRLHRALRGAERPFVVAEPTERALAGASRQARGGTVCVWARRMPRDARLIRAFTADREPTAGMIVCARSADAFAAIDVPPLPSRRAEIDRIIDAYAADAIHELGARRPSFTAADRQWLVAHPPATLGEIEVATRRLIAIRELGGVTHAAPRLGITHSALSRWVARRFARPRKDRRAW